MARIQRAAAHLAVATALVVTSGCSATNPITTDLENPPSHGLAVDISENAGLVNLLVLTAADGATGALYGGAWNHNTEPVELTLALRDGTRLATFTIPAGETVRLGATQELRVRIPDVPVRPGAVMQLTAATDRGGAVTAPVPVLDGTLPPYDDLIPPPL